MVIQSLTKIANWIMDKSIYFSFDRSGFERHEREFLPFTSSFAEDKRVLITGGNSGIGWEAAHFFALKKMEVHLICRNKEKGEQAKARLISLTGNAKIFLHLLDLQSLDDVIQFSKTSLPPIDILINNAGAMPLNKIETASGVESIFTSQVLAHFVLTHTLIERGVLSDKSRVIFVSSGGMYLQKLSLNDLNWDRTPYNHYKAYANAKRAQVILTSLFAKKYPHILFSCMHPGWVETKGVENYMPLFFRWMKKRLRTPFQGADTVIWLALTSEGYPNGEFWFDRKIAPKHFFSWTKESDSDKESLWSLCLQKGKN